MSSNFRDGIVCGIAWLVCILALALIWLQSGWIIAATALLPLVSFVDLAIWLGFSVFRLPCGFTEWVCYPFWPWKYHGFGMRTAVLIRVAEIALILLSGHWLWETVKKLF